MKKNLLAIGLIALALPATAQNVLMHVDNAAIVYVGKDALIYNGGGLQTRGSGLIDNHGNVMIEGAAGDVFRNLDAGGTEIINGTGGRFFNRLNEPANYAQVNSNGVAAGTNPPTPAVDPLPPVYTYGQLYVNGLAQASVTGVVNQEFRQVSHGAYQQMAFPFFGKPISTLSAELGSTFNTTRYSGREILTWSNPDVVSKNLPATGLATRLGENLSPFTYFIVGSTGLDLTQTRTMVGRPVVTAAVQPPAVPAPGVLNSIVQLSSAGTMSANGSTPSFGLNGNNLNEYGEKYNTYLQDNFAPVAAPWVGNFGKNIYQFGNPYLTNLDLSKIAFEDAQGIGDGNNIENIFGVRLEVQGVQYSTTAGGGSSSFKYITFDTAGPVIGDVDYTMVRPMGTFVLKLKTNTPQQLNFGTLRRFKYSTRSTLVDYSVAAAKNSAGTVKQLGVIGLDANGNELQRTYFVLSPNTVSGYSPNVTAEVLSGGGTSLGTWQEDGVNGGFNNPTAFMYINEANDNDFKGKNIKLANYNPDIVSFKFEIRENAGQITAGQHLLSSGEGFYYKKSGNNPLLPAVQGAVVAAVPGTPTEGAFYDLYYGTPNSSVLGTTEVKSNLTMVVYNGDDDSYFVRFDPNWKKADIQVYDMSGKVVLSKKEVNASQDFKLSLADNLKVTYVVAVTSDKGEKVNVKIIK